MLDFSLDQTIPQPSPMSSDRRLGLAAEPVPARQQLPENSSADTWWRYGTRERRSDEPQCQQPPCAAPAGKYPWDNAVLEN